MTTALERPQAARPLRLHDDAAPRHVVREERMVEGYWPATPTRAAQWVPYTLVVVEQIEPQR